MRFIGTGISSLPVKRLTGQIKWLVNIQNRFKTVSYAKLQTTLRYMTKLDRAFNNEEELLKLSRYYEARNITALDLFKILKRV